VIVRPRPHSRGLIPRAYFDRAASTPSRTSRTQSWSRSRGPRTSSSRVADFSFVLGSNRFRGKPKCRQAIGGLHSTIRLNIMGPEFVLEFRPRRTPRGRPCLDGRRDRRVASPSWLHRDRGRYASPVHFVLGRKPGRGRWLDRRFPDGDLPLGNFDLTDRFTASWTARVFRLRAPIVSSEHVA
jgi:hypothetical protein